MFSPSASSQEQIICGWKFALIFIFDVGPFEIIMSDYIEYSDLVQEVRGALVSNLACVGVIGGTLIKCYVL